MDLRHMRHFVAVAEELHFGRAARRLNIAQPPLSQSIRRLEDHLRVTLLNRSRRHVELTRAGEVFLVEARRTLMHAELAQKLAQREALETPTVRIGFIGPALYRALPEFLLRFRAECPDTNVELFEQGLSDQVRGVSQCKFEIGFIPANFDHADPDATPQIAELERMVVERAADMAVVPSNWEIARHDSVTLSELAKHPFIRPPNKYAASSQIIEIFKRIGVVPRVVQEATQINTVLSLVGAGIGCSFMTATARLVEPRNVSFLTISDEMRLPAWELLMIWHPGMVGEAGRAFVESVRTCLREKPHLLEITTLPKIP